MDKNVLDLIHEVHRIPHLKLPLVFDAAKMKSELVAIEKWTPHSHAGFRDISAEEMEAHSEGYSGVSLYEFNGEQDYATDNYEIFEGREPSTKFDPVTKHVLFLPTPLVEKMPYTHSVVESISKRKGRTRVMRSDANHAIVWHSHNRGPWFNPFMQEAIVHVPIKTQMGVLHTVRDYRSASSEVEKLHKVSLETLAGNPENFLANYKEGECWIFNSWHDHYYHNYSHEVRFTLLLYIRWFNNEEFVRLVEKAVSEYAGPRLLKD